MIPLEILIVLVCVAILCAMVWTIFDHRDLRAKVEADNAEIAQEIAKLKQRAGL